MELERELRAFNAFFKEMDDLYHDLAVGAGLSDSAFDIFYTLRTLGEGCLQRDVCGCSFVSKQTVNSSIRTLERRGLLSLCPGKGRNLHIYLTPAGRQLMEERIDPVLRMEVRAFSTLSAADRAELLRLNRAYLDALRSHAGAQTFDPQENPLL